MTRRAIAVLLCSLVVGCAGDEAASGASSSAIEVGYSALRISLPVLVAQDRGLFRRRGLDVTLKRYETAQPLVEEVLDGRIDAGGYAALPIVLTAAARDGSTVRLATALVEDEAHPISYLLRAKGGGAIASIGDLRGRRLGILPTVAYERWAAAVLRHAGVDPASVTIVPIAAPQQAQALASGGVDGLLTNDPMATAAIARGVAEPLGDAAPVPRALAGELVFGSFLLSPALVRDRPAIAAALVAALDDAIAAIDADQAGARRILQPFVRETERPFVDRYPDARYRPSRALDDAALAREVAAMQRVGILDRSIDVRGWTLTGDEARP